MCRRNDEAALNTLAVAAPQWLQKLVIPSGQNVMGDEWKIPACRKVRKESSLYKVAYIKKVDMDGHSLLTAVYEKEASLWLAAITAVNTLSRYGYNNIACNPQEVTGLQRNKDYHPLFNLLVLLMIRMLIMLVNTQLLLGL
jgi:hypothetical protein